MAKLYKCGHRYFKTEKELLRYIDGRPRHSVIIYEELESVNASDYKRRTLQERDRDIQLRSILGELDTFEQDYIVFLEMYRKIAPENDEKTKLLRDLNLIGANKKSFSALITRYKKYLMTVSTDTEWYKALFKCHNFRDYKYSTKFYDRETRKYIERPIPDEIIVNFTKAKEELRKKK